jgi:hypothetical protein
MNIDDLQKAGEIHRLPKIDRHFSELGPAETWSVPALGQRSFLPFFRREDLASAIRVLATPYLSELKSLHYFGKRSLVNVLSGMPWRMPLVPPTRAFAVRQTIPGTTARPAPGRADIGQTFLSSSPITISAIYSLVRVAFKSVDRCTMLCGIECFGLRSLGGASARRRRAAPSCKVCPADAFSILVAKARTAAITTRRESAASKNAGGDNHQ